MPKFVEVFFSNLQKRLAELVLAAIVAVLFTGGSNWLWRVSRAEPAIAALRSDVRELQQEITVCSTRRECERLHGKVDDLASRVSRLEGLMSK